MALGGPNIYPRIAGCSYPDCLPGATVAKVKTDSYEQARRDLRDLLIKTRRHGPSGRLAAVIAWAGDDLDQMTGMSRAACRACREDTGPCVCLHDCGALTCTSGFGKEPLCSYALVEDKYYCTPTCIVGHRRQDGRCG